MYRALLSFLLLLALVTACRTDFQVNDQYKQINVIYGLMTSEDSIEIGVNNNRYHHIKNVVQYFRISKAFLNRNGLSAATIAKTPDSLFNKNWLVKLSEFDLNGVFVKSWTLDTTSSIPRDPGYFVNPYQVLYKTPIGFKLDSPFTNFKYSISVFDTKTNVISSAETNIVGIAGFARSYSNSIQFKGNHPTKFSWDAAKNSRFYDFSIIVHYIEWPKSNSADISHKTAIWNVATNMLTDNTNGGYTVNYEIEPQNFYTFMSQTIPVDNNVKRKLEDNAFEVVIAGGGEEIYTYMQVNSPSIGLVQKKSDYTNVNNGYGIFSSRSISRYFRPIESATMDKLIDSLPTSKLGFVR